jgi:hypothetical protein
MWQPPTPITRRGRQLSDVEAWIHVFAAAWERLEHDPEELHLAGFDAFGAAAAAQYGEEDPARVARRLYPDAGAYMPDLYPGYRVPIVVQAPPPPPDWTRVKEEGVQFSF